LGTAISSPNIGTNGNYGSNNNFTVSLNIAGLATEKVEVYLDFPQAPHLEQ
jgi:hypothetical protein